MTEPPTERYRFPGAKDLNDFPDDYAWIYGGIAFWQRIPLKNQAPGLRTNDPVNGQAA